MFYEDEQVSLFAPDMQSTKTFLEPCQATGARTGRRSSRRSSASQTQTLPQFLFLKKGSGTNSEDTWVSDETACGALPTGYTTLSSGAWHSVGDELRYYATTPDGQPVGYYLTLSIGERPRRPVQSKLSHILEKNPDMNRYKLSQKACTGILTRAIRRGKKLPDALEKALRAQSVSKNEQESQEGARESSSSMSEQAPCQRSQTSQSSTVCLEGNGYRESHRGDGWRESDQMYTLNTTEQHAVAYGISPYASNAMLSDNPHSGIYEADTSRTLDLNGGSPACNQGGIAIVEPTAYNGEVITSPTNQSKPKSGVCHLQSAGFKQGNGANARGIGYQEEMSPSLTSAQSGTNQTPVVFVTEHGDDSTDLIYDARGNGDGAVCPTLTGDHQDRITDYTAIVLTYERTIQQGEK